MTLNLATTLEESTKANPGKTVLILGELKMSYAELWGAAKTFANGLVSMGLKPGDKVALMVPSVPQWVLTYYGILSTGASVVPLNVLGRGGLPLRGLRRHGPDRLGKLFGAGGEGPQAGGGV